MKTLIKYRPLSFKEKSFLFLIILFLISFSISAQTYSNNEATDTTIGGLSITQSQFSTFFNTTANNKLETITNNALVIEQVGSNNNATVKTASRASDINIGQNGLRNNVNLTYKVDAVVADLSQNGNDNRILDYVIDPTAKVSLELEQNGNNLTFDKFGTNSITKNIKFNQTEASPVIIIRSFN